MVKKYTMTLLLIVMFAGLHSQDNSPSIFGKWQHISENSSDGVHGIDQKISNGEILIFEKRNIVKDSIGLTGKYYLNQNILQITFDGKNREYEISFSKDDNILILVPTHHACIEGCYSVYSRLKDQN